MIINEHRLRRLFSDRGVLREGEPPRYPEALASAQPPTPGGDAAGDHERTARPSGLGSLFARADGAVTPSTTTVVSWSAIPTRASWRARASI